MLKCAACGSDDFWDFLDVYDNRGQLHPFARCQSCRLAQARVPPAAEELAAFYARYAYDSEAAWESSLATERSLERLGRKLAPYRQQGRLLDVGCGSGILLRALRRQGWTVEGTELSGVAVEQLRAQGLTVHYGSVETLELQTADYDVVVMSETIEHVLDPMRAVRFARRTLRPGGVLFLTTPNVDSLSRRLLGAKWRALCYPDHLFCFNRRSMHALLREAGLKPAAVWTEGINPYEIIGVLRGGRLQSSERMIRRAEALRAATVTSTTYSWLKSSVNTLLDTLHLGDTLKALAENPHHS